MKKLALALVCLVSVAFFASCTDPVENPEPSIAILAGEGYVTDGAIVNLNETVNFGFILASNLETNKELKSLVITIDDAEFDNVELTGTSYTYTSELVYSMEEREIIGESVIKAIVTDVEGETATATITLSINEPSAPLFVTPINWVRRGANVTEGAAQLEALGLTWAGSYKEIFATFKPIEGYNLYKIDANWEEILTVADKAALFATAMETMHPMESFREITTAHSSDYDAIIGTIKDGEMHLMHITHCAVETGNYGTQLTITGEAK